jgi:hypothetical protein
MVARLVLLFVLQVVLFLSGGGARWSVAAERPLPRARGPPGSPCALNPLPDLVAADPVDTFEAAGGPSRQCWRWSEAEALRSSRPDDFPSARGSSSIQGISGEGAAARLRHVSLLVVDIDLHEDGSVISKFVVSLSVIPRCISAVSSQKKKKTDAYPVCRVNTCVSSFLRVAGTRVLLDSSVLSM